MKLMIRLLGPAHLHMCLDALVENRPFGVVERVIILIRPRHRFYTKLGYDGEGSKAFKNMYKTSSTFMVQIYKTSRCIREMAILK
jgi:hypothetical protein